MLCLSGEIGWARLSRGEGDGTTTKLGGATAIALFPREHGDAWQTLRTMDDDAVTMVTRPRPAETRSAESPRTDEQALSEYARHLLEVLRRRGASFFRELIAASGLEEAELRRALGELASAGFVASDGFAGLRAIVGGASRNGGAQGGEGRREARTDPAGRWSVVRGGDDSAAAHDAAVEHQAWALLRRYGVVFRRVLAREALAAPWRDLARVYRRLEARGEIRGGRFVAGMSGEQFALPRAVERLREVRRSSPPLQTIVITAADPLNLAGIVTAGERVRASRRTRIAYRAGVPVALREADVVRPLAPLDAESLAEVTRVLNHRRSEAVGI
jgi:ATP-dependent helicase Lhr and Lhr-like helicase